MKYDIDNGARALSAFQRKISAYAHAIGIINYDGVTTAPPATADNRAVSLSVLSEELYKLTTSDEAYELLEYLDNNKDSLSVTDKRAVKLLIKDLKDTKKIPLDEYIEYKALQVKSDDVWHRAKASSDFEMFLPYLEKVFEYEKRFASYIEPDKDPYDHCLENYEEGLNKKTLDTFFESLKRCIVPLVKEISGKKQIDDSIRRGRFPVQKQEELSRYLMKVIGLDFTRVGLATTEHPFTTSLGSHLDERITTHYYEDDFVCSMYSVIHEGGHALYDTGSDKSLAYTVLDGGAAMSIHESQSRFYENIIGRSKSFCEFLFPYLHGLFPEHMKGRTAEEFYRAVNKVEPSLIRTEADELTYCLHVMVRYELEKMIFDGELKVSDLPRAWNALYKEYLGIDVPDDKRGVLQDSHWAGGLVGYFPSYALGNAYGAHFMYKMKQTVDIDGCVIKGDLTPVNDWNRENIWRHGRLYTPAELLERVLGEPFDPCHYVKYLETKFSDIYGL